MHGESDTAGPSWDTLQDPVPLQQAAECLSHYLGDSTRFALSDILSRRRVPVLARRSDVLAMLPDRVEDLLGKASKVVVISHDNAIRAHYRFSGEQEADQLFGPLSNWRSFTAPDSRGLALIFDRVLVCWTTLLRELRRVGWGPADEAALRKLKLWPGSWEPISSGSANEARASAEPAGDTLTLLGQPPSAETGSEAALAESGMSASPDNETVAENVVERLADFIFSKRPELGQHQDHLYKAARADGGLGRFTKADFLAAYQQVYETKPGRPQQADGRCAPNTERTPMGRSLQNKFRKSF